MINMSIDLEISIEVEELSYKVRGDYKKSGLAFDRLSLLVE